MYYAWNCRTSIVYYGRVTGRGVVGCHWAVRLHTDRAKMPVTMKVATCRTWSVEREWRLARTRWVGIPRHRLGHPRADPRRHVRHARFPEVIPMASWTTRRHSRDDPRRDAGEDVGVGIGVVERQLIHNRRTRTRQQLRFTRAGDKLHEDAVWPRFTVCERGDRVKNELLTRYGRGWTYRKRSSAGFKLTDGPWRCLHEANRQLARSKSTSNVLWTGYERDGRILEDSNFIALLKRLICPAIANEPTTDMMFLSSTSWLSVGFM